jgi:hypothetical protein
LSSNPAAWIDAKRTNTTEVVNQADRTNSRWKVRRICRISLA